MSTKTAGLLLSFALLLGSVVSGQPLAYDRPVDAAPTDETIGEGYQTPPVQHPLPASRWRQTLDVALLAAALALTSWLVHRRRHRVALYGLTVVCLVYFGFVRQGCICPIGSIQNVTAGLFDPAATVPYLVVGVFALPLLAALFFGRVFCASVCPLGAIQEVVVVSPVEVPRSLDRVLGSLKWAYLVAAVAFAALPAGGRDFVICRYDPFVGFFRFSGSVPLLAAGAGLLLLGLVVGRPYCRYLCPYGALLSLASRLAWRPVSITPGRELDCGLCTHACPYGAIEELRAHRGRCLACARCFRSCPVPGLPVAADGSDPEG